MRGILGDGALSAYESRNVFREARRPSLHLTAPHSLRRLQFGFCPAELHPVYLSAV